MGVRSALTFSDALASLEPGALKVIAASVPSWAAIVQTVFCWCKGQMDSDAGKEGRRISPPEISFLFPHLPGHLPLSSQQTLHI